LYPLPRRFDFFFGFFFLTLEKVYPRGVFFLPQAVACYTAFPQDFLQKKLFPLCHIVSCRVPLFFALHEARTTVPFSFAHMHKAGALVQADLPCRFFLARDRAHTLMDPDFRLFSQKMPLIWACYLSIPVVSRGGENKPRVGARPFSSAS